MFCWIPDFCSVEEQDTCKLIIDLLIGFFYAVGLFNSDSATPPTRFKTVISQAVRTGKKTIENFKFQ